MTIDIGCICNTNYIAAIIKQCAAAATAGLSVNSYIVTAITEKMERDQGAEE